MSASKGNFPTLNPVSLWQNVLFNKSVTRQKMILKHEICRWQTYLTHAPSHSSIRRIKLLQTASLTSWLSAAVGEATRHIVLVHFKQHKLMSSTQRCQLQSFSCTPPELLPPSSKPQPDVQPGRGALDGTVYNSTACAEQQSKHAISQLLIYNPSTNLIN